MSSEEGSQLTGRLDGAIVRATVPGVADATRARRFLSTVRRIDRVVIHFESGVARCEAIGRQSRLPLRAPIRLAVALGLAQLGVPTAMTGVNEPTG